MAGRKRAPLRERTASNVARVPRDPVVGLGGVGRVRMVEIQRARLIAAMVEVSSERGLGSVTVAHVVERAGVSRRTFYELFTDREDCFLAAFDEAVARARRYVLDSYDPGVRWVDRVRMALLGLLSFLDVERGAGRLLIVCSSGAGVSVLERRRALLAQVVAAVDEGRMESKAGGELPPLTAEGVVGGVLSVLHSRLLDEQSGCLVELTGSLMSLIVLPYLGPAAARREMELAVPKGLGCKVGSVAHDLLRELDMRLTYRTVRVLMAVADNPGGSNRQLADGAGIGDQGQISKLLRRLDGLGLIANTGAGFIRGAPNSWVLTAKGREVQGALAQESDRR